VLDARGAVVPAVIHWGADLGALTDAQLETLADSRVRVVGPSAADAPIRLGLVPLLADGWTGLPALEGVTLALSAVEPVETGVRVTLTGSGLSLVVELLLDAHGVLHARSRLTNLDAQPYALASLATVLPLPAVAQERLDFTGVWAAERQPQRARIQHGTALRESRHGRNGHDDAYVTVAGTPGFGFRHGEVWAVHLGWSGDKRSWIDRSAVGLSAIAVGELLAPGEIRLEQGDEYVSPWAYAAWSDAGLDGLSTRFHGMFRALAAHPSSARPLTLNTWEAVYFEQDLPRLGALADLAAGVGVERFVLDDGWMTGRTDDRRALGDWTVDPARWPDGLGPLIERVRAAGMQFGLWVEPEMVSLDSALARQHPEWVLSDTRSWRHQFVLDLANDAAREHVRDALLALLDEYPIDYLKWDMNRDQLAGSVHAQVTATYRLMDELRAAHPELEIESCSSGGARIDAGVLTRTQRVWPSDTNDAHDRQAIMRWTSLLVPLEYLGAHVGSAPAHTTGRSQSLSFRLATALLGHAGIEWDLAAASTEELAALTVWAEQYRALRGLLHSGELVRGDEDSDPIVTGVVAADRSEAVFVIACLHTPRESVRLTRRIPGLDPRREYRVSVVDIGAEAATYAGIQPAWVADGITLTGAVLGAVGLEPPLLQPDEALVVRLVAV
jgi:alpha-galactosidase